MISILNSTFDFQEENVTKLKDAKTFGLTLNGSEDVEVKGCTFANKGYASILNESTGNVSIEDCKFVCASVHNPIEGGKTAANGNVTVKSCEFVGAPGNNYINFYSFADGVENVISDCTFEPTVDNNVIRVSNTKNAGAKIVLKDCEYNFAEGEATDYTGLVLFQDFTNKNGQKQDFTKVTVELDNVLCNGEKVNKEGAAKGCIFYVYEDAKGLITGQDNDPVIVIK